MHRDLLGVSNLHNSPSVSVSRRPCPLCAAASASKPYSFPKRSQAARTPGVESTSVLEERGGGFGNVRIHLIEDIIITTADRGAAPVHVEENLEDRRYVV